MTDEWHFRVNNSTRVFVYIYFGDNKPIKGVEGDLG